MTTDISFESPGPHDAKYIKIIPVAPILTELTDSHLATLTDVSYLLHTLGAIPDCFRDVTKDGAFFLDSPYPQLQNYVPHINIDGPVQVQQHAKVGIVPFCHI